MKRASIGYGAYGYYGQAPTRIPTAEELSILGRCPNTQMACLDSRGNDLWPLVAHLDNNQKAVLGRCPAINQPCWYTPPGGGEQIDLWMLARGEMPGGPGVSTITPEEEAAILQATLPVPVPEPDFLRRNALPLFVGGGVLLLGIVGMFLMLKV